ncbi:MAG: hypothetical protein ABJN22_04490 [Litorimonas sp.]
METEMGEAYNHDDVLLPLAITVIIDKKVRKPEMSSFSIQAKGLFDLFSLDPLTDAEIENWFDTHSEELETKLNSPRRNTLVLRALSRFKQDRDVEAVYDAMVSISVSDDEYVKSESELIKSAASIWGFARPPIKVDRA